jgi:hypothetical protein
MRRLSLAVLILLVSVWGAPPAQAGPIISGTITGFVESGPSVPFGDAINHVTLWWSISHTDVGWFYGSSYTQVKDTDVAYATGVTDISQITDGSAFSFTSSWLGPIYDADARGGIGDFLVLRNIVTGHYGVIRVDDISAGGAWVATLDATWWFQPDGSADFSDGHTVVPDPGASLLLLGMGLAALKAWERRR